MDTRLDSPFESWGGFSKTAIGSSIIHGRLRYDPKEGIKLDLVEHPDGAEAGLKAFFLDGEKPTETIFGRLVDGTLVTLSDCFITKLPSN